MHTQQCRYLLALAEQRNFSKAAAALFVSQPYLSRLVADVEQELGTPIFDRSRNKPMTVTPAGEAYLTHMREILHSEQKMKAQIEEIIARRVGLLRIGISSTNGAYILPKALSTFKNLYPGVHVEVTENNSKNLMEKLLGGTLDFCCLALPEYPEEVALDQLVREHILLVLPSSHPFGHPGAKGNFAKPRPFPRELIPPLGNENFITLTDAQGIGRHTRIIFAEFGIQPTVFMETPNLEIAYRLAANGAGLTFVPEICTRFSRFEEEPFYFSLGSPPYMRSLSMVHLKRRRLSQTDRDFIEVMRDSV